MQKVVEFSTDPLLKRKIEMAVNDLGWTSKNLFVELSDANKRILVDFLNDMITHENPRPNTKKAYVQAIVLLARYFEHKKSFKEFTNEEILAYLQSYKRTSAADPKEQWINTYNQKTTILTKFYKWLYFPDIPAEQRGKKEFVKPVVIKNLPLFVRKEKTSVEASHLWLPGEDVIFLKHCPDVRLSLYHTMADDTSGRPHELLSLRFGDVKIKNHNGRTYGEVEIGRGGKTKSRTVPLITSIPYFKQWYGQNPTDPNLFIFRTFSPQAKYKNIPMTVTALGTLYRRMKDYFKTLLERADVTPEDKQTIRTMLERPWNPYIRRHTSLTEKARLLPNDYSLRLHAGWTKNSKMVEIYTHELGGESSNELLAAYGVVPRAVDGKSELLKPKECPNCREPNKVDARFCANPKCGMPLSFDAYQDMKDKQEEKDRKLEQVWQALYDQGVIKKA